MRTEQISRLYLQCKLDEDVSRWPDEGSGRNSKLGSSDGWMLTAGPILQKGATGMRSFVVEPMQYERSFLAGDSADIVPPTGAKGLHLAVADIRVLACALAHFYATGRRDLLDAYSQTCLPRIWKVQRFSWWMTSCRTDSPTKMPSTFAVSLPNWITSPARARHLKGSPRTM
jgi:p-hydroxybenzoate 3-monooxygenase